MSPRGPLDLGAAARTQLPKAVAPRTVPELLARAVREAPDVTALIADSFGQGETAATHRELAEAAAHVAGGLAGLGVAHGDRVGILVTNAAAFEAHLTIHGAHRAGAIAVPINPRASADELLWCLGAAGCTVLVYEPSLAPKVEQIRAGAGDLALVALGEGEGTAWSELLDHAPLAQVALEPGDGAGWVFTSGTTGFPKIVAHTHATSVACGVQIAEGWDLRRGDVYVNAHPMFTASGTNTDLLAALWAFATNVVESRFDPSESVARVNRVGATSVMWMTPMLRLIFDAQALSGLADGPLRRVMYGGQAMPPEFHLAVDDRIVRERRLEAIHMIGLSEAGPGGILLDSEFHRERLGAVGNRGFSRALTEFDLLDPEGDPVGPGVNGELCYRSPSIMQGYVGAEEASEEALRDGWLHSGDLCRRDEDGFVYFADRMKDVIRRGGVNIASAEVERVVGESADVAEVAAVPHPHPVLGEVVRVVVVRRPGSEIDADAVIAHAASQLADYKVPRVVDFVDELPRNDMGKITKALLRE